MVTQIERATGSTGTTGANESDIGRDEPRYRSFVLRDYIDARSADNYADAGAPDTQISDFLVPV